MNEPVHITFEMSSGQIITMIRTFFVRLSWGGAEFYICSRVGPSSPNIPPLALSFSKHRIKTQSTYHTI